MQTKRIFLSCLLPIGLCAAPARRVEKVLIKTPKPYTGLVNTIAAGGGKVTRQYKYIDAVAAEIPVGALGSISGMLAPGALRKDLVIPAPQAVDTLRGRPQLGPAADTHNIAWDSAKGLSAADVQRIAAVNPAAYTLNNAINGTAALHAGGITGFGVVVAVIDSGIRPGFPHLTLDGSVIGCEDFAGDGLGCSNFANNPHGTFVAGMISANAIFGFAPGSTFRQAVEAECPACFQQVPGAPPNTFIPMIGSAPHASIYALRVLPATGGAPTSVILAAIERAIELRKSGMNLRVANMSLGGGTPNPAGDLFDQAVDKLLENGIVPVVAAANTGPSSLTVGSPATALSALTVAAANLPHNERILRRLQFGPVVGALYRPSPTNQTAYFSSRGPNADGRIDPDVTANGFANYGQGYSPDVSGITLGSGTSFSSPTVAGVVALLAQAFPGATAGQLWNAVRSTANPNVLMDGSTYLDQGAGYVDALAARNRLAAGGVPSALPRAGKPNTNVKVNIEQNTFLDVRDGAVQENTPWLKPGQRHETLYRVHANTRQIVVTLDNVQKSLPPAQQNQLFGDDFLVAIHSSETSAIGDVGDYDVFAYALTGGAWVINDPEPGIMRITLNGDWTNAGNVAGRLRVISVTNPLPKFTAQGKIANLQSIAIPVSVPAGTAMAQFRLGWREDWGSYPSNDVDLLLLSPSGALNVDAATLRNPEVAAIAKPEAGTWQAIIVGYQVNGGDDKYEFRVDLDGKVVK
jgi:hypothetical protein